MKYFAGWDGGGTGTTVECMGSAGKQLLVAKAGPLNPNGNPAEVVKQSVQDLLSHMMTLPGGLEACANLCISVAGISNRLTTAMLSDFLHSFGFTSPYFFVGDSESALYGALEDEPGIVLIAGTGSLCYGQDSEGVAHRVGGWGHLIDDAGSGYAIGRDILTAVVKAADGRAPETFLTELVYQRLEISSVAELITWLYSPGIGKKEIAALAPLCSIAWRDAAALAIKEQAADDLTLLIQTAASKLECTSIPLVLLGSVIQKDEGLRGLLLKRLEASDIHFALMPPKADAAHGAALLARQRRA